MKRIVCPTDFSEASRRALEHAVPLAWWHEGEVVALHAFRAPAYLDVPYGAVPPPASPELREQLEIQAWTFLEPALRAGVSARVDVVEGDPVATILDRAASADLLVMGTHGRSGLLRFALGSVTETVLHRAPCPVLSVAPADDTAPAAAFRSVLCAVDLAGDSAETLRAALALAGQREARLVLVHVLEDRPEREALARASAAWGEALAEEAVRTWKHLEESARARLFGLLPAEARLPAAVEERVLSGKPGKEIVRLARELGSDVIVMGTHASGLQAMVFGSTADEVVRHAPCPVLTVRPHAVSELVGTSAVREGAQRR